MAEEYRQKLVDRGGQPFLSLCELCVPLRVHAGQFHQRSRRCTLVIREVSFDRPNQRAFQHLDSAVDQEPSGFSIFIKGVREQKPMVG